jgi:hypothetical protein
VFQFPPPVSPARGAFTDWDEIAQAHDERAIYQASPDELPGIDIHSLCTLSDASHQRSHHGSDGRNSAPTLISCGGPA